MKAIKRIRYTLYFLGLSFLVFGYTHIFGANKAMAHPRPAAPEIQKVGPQLKVRVKNTSIRFKTRSEFVLALLPHAKEVGEMYNIDPKILIAHAAHETNWGKSIPCHQNGLSSYNLFGIKAGKKSPQKVHVKTSEYIRGIKKAQYASFRAYTDFGDCFKHYINLISKERFKAALKHGKNAKAYFTHLQKAGYATDPKYAYKLVAVYNHPTIKKIIG